ncbi:hypothetical protein [uncultured Fibrobacter sp.]|uniref:hypothetical protein n=1 Tax=uncultured Fibrobacter sp. TaxID=261512 RepID=UPI00261185C3|nr:hypothetical protein [uncultured Fibrobacter sp.]
MKKLIAFLFLAFAVVCSAQSSIKPEFQAFSGALLKLKKVEKGYHKFRMTVDVAPWAFQADGEVQAPGGDPEALITGLFDGEVYAVLAYVPSTAAGSDGKEYQVGFFDMMLYFEEEPTKIRNLRFKLLPPANDEWAMGILKDALESGSLIGNVWGGKYEKAITKASADPLDKAKLRALQKKSGKSLDDNDGTITSRKRRVEADEEVAPKKKKAKTISDDDDGTINKRKRRVDDDDDDSPKKKKKKKKKASAADECDDPSLSVKERRRCQLKYK